MITPLSPGSTPDETIRAVLRTAPRLTEGDLNLALNPPSPQVAQELDQQAAEREEREQREAAEEQRRRAILIGGAAVGTIIVLGGAVALLRR